MYSSMIGKIDKARRYALEPQRARITMLRATFHGEHDQYALGLDGDQWTCSCHSFQVLGLCAHVMAAQRLLDAMLSVEARNASGPEPLTQSALIGKIEKARRYAQQPERLQIHQLNLTFLGGHDSYVLTLNGDVWTCSCHTFQTVGLCAHVMAMQRILEPMLGVEARTGAGVAAVV